MKPAAANTRIFEIFRTGSHVSMAGQATTWTDNDLALICHNYAFQPPAPLVLGHPASNGPRYGSVRELFHKRGVLFAIAECGRDLIAMVRAGHYKNRSSSFVKSNEGLGWMLRHVGFLGANPPAVRGLAPLAFAEPYVDAPGVVSFAQFPAVSTGRASLPPEITPPPGYRFDPDRLALYRNAWRVMTDCPSLSFSEAVSLANRIT